MTVFNNAVFIALRQKVMVTKGKYFQKFCKLKFIRSFFIWCKCLQNIGCNAAKCSNKKECILGEYKQRAAEQDCTSVPPFICPFDTVWISSNDEEADEQGI